MKRFIPEDVTGFMVSTGIVKQSEVMLAKASHHARVLAIDAFWPTGAPDTGTGTLVARSRMRRGSASTASSCSCRGT